MSRRSPRLRFSEEERAAPELKKAVRKADRAADRVEKAEARIPKKSVRATETVVDSKTGAIKKRLFYEEVDKKKPPSKLTHALRQAPGGAALIVVLLLNFASSCSILVQSGTSSLAISTYPSQDSDMLAAEAQYAGMEAVLQSKLDNYTATHDYDEYHFDLDTIEHDPYERLPQGGEKRHLTYYPCISGWNEQRVGKRGYVP